MVPDHGHLGTVRAYDIINAYTLAFARFHLFGDERVIDLLGGTDDRWSEDVRLNWKPGSSLGE